MLMETVIFQKETYRAMPCVATIGCFDGVHRGHRFLIERVMEGARRLGRGAMVVTFDRHPRTVVTADCPGLLTTMGEKLRLLEQTGIDRCVVMPFDREMAMMGAEVFMQRILRGQLGVEQLIMGYDNRFGRRSEGATDDYVMMGERMGLKVTREEPLMVKGVKVSSSVVRALLSEGEVAMAAHCLGYHYRMCGRVVHGEHIGSRLGFPTANMLPIDDEKMWPARGVYAVDVWVDGVERRLQGLCNIGVRPTFGGQHVTLETHLLDFEGEIYDRMMTVAFVDRLRGEQRFRTTNELVKQMERDRMAAHVVFERKNND